jgi:hypothetical protein
LDVDAISAGQRIRVFGDLNADETELDAARGYVIMLLTAIKGTVADVDQADPFRHLTRAGVSQDLTQLDEAPIVESKGDGSGLFQIFQDGSRQFFFDFEGFTGELSERLENDAAVMHILATGFFDDTNVILESDFIIVGLN